MSWELFGYVHKFGQEEEEGLEYAGEDEFDDYLGHAFAE